MTRSGEGVEPVQGKVPTKGLFYRLPAASVLSGLVLSFEALDALEGQRERISMAWAVHPQPWRSRARGPSEG